VAPYTRSLRDAGFTSPIAAMRPISSTRVLPTLNCNLARRSAPNKFGAIRGARNGRYRELSTLTARSGAITVTSLVESDDPRFPTQWSRSSITSRPTLDMKTEYRSCVSRCRSLLAMAHQCAFEEKHHVHSKVMLAFAVFIGPAWMLLRRRSFCAFAPFAAAVYGRLLSGPLTDGDPDCLSCARICRCRSVSRLF
jgi:hypothetical protein